MKAGHDLDMAVTKRSLATIRERYNILDEYGLHVSRSGQRPYSSDAPGVCISVDALEVGLRFPLHPIIEECIRWWRISPNRMDLGDLRGMPKVSGGKTPSVRAAVPAREVGVSPAREAPKTSSKRPTDTSTEQIDDLARRHKKVKILSRRHKSCHGEGGSRSHSKGKELATPVEEPETLVESAEEDASPVFHRSRSMKDLFKTKGTPPPVVGAGAVHTPLGGFAGLSRQGDGVGKFSTLISTLLVSFRLSPYDHYFVQNQHFQMVLFDRVHDAGRLITFMDYHISNLQQGIDTLKSGGGPEAVAAAEERASELEKELEKIKREWDEALQRLKASDKELKI
ncbi:hypothetical protein BHM03_00034512 [Ensete ventricosum]|nr:hypothetical protein BHM03_00034512 [Ensete ventricosum]